MILINRIPFFGSLSLNDLIKALTACFVALQVIATGAVVRSLTELMFIMVPDFFFAIPLRTTLVQFKPPLRLTSISRE